MYRYNIIYLSHQPIKHNPIWEILEMETEAKIK